MRCSLAIALAWLVLAPGALPAEEAGLAASGVVAIVNGTPILRQALNDVVDATVSLGNRKVEGSAKRQLQSDALSSLIELELLFQASEKADVHVAEADVDAQIQKTESRFATASEFQSAMRKRGVTLEQLRRDTMKTLAVERYLQQAVYTQVEVTDGDARTFYDANQSQFVRPEQVRARHILVRASQTASAAVRKRAQERAQKMLGEIRHGRDFAEVARSSSDDSASAKAGGELGYFSRGEMLPELEEVAFQLERGHTSDVFATKLGFHILSVIDHRAAGVRPFEEVKEGIRTTLVREARERARGAHVAELRSHGEVQILDPALAATAREN